MTPKASSLQVTVLCPIREGSKRKTHSWCQTSRPTKRSEGIQQWDSHYSHVALGGQVLLVSHPARSGHPDLGAPDHPEENRVAGNLADRDGPKSQLHLQK